MRLVLLGLTVQVYGFCCVLIGWRLRAHIDGGGV